MYVYECINRAEEHACQMFAHTCSRNYRCMRMNISTRAINAAAVPFFTAGSRTRRETSLVSELYCTSPHNQTVNFLLFVFVFSLSADSVLIKRLLELY